MLLHCLKRKEKKSKNPSGVVRVVCGCNKSRFIKEQEVSGILNSLTKSFSKIPIVSPILF